MNLANAYDASSVQKVCFYILISLYIVLSLQIPMSKNRHNMCTNCIVFVCTILYCKSVAVYLLSLSDCLSVCVINMYCIWMQCIPLSVSVRLSVRVVSTVSLFNLYFRTPFLLLL